MINLTNIKYDVKIYIQYFFYKGESENMTYSYKVKDITGDYAVLLRTDIKTEDTILVAMALLPDGTDIGSDLLWENLEYTLVN